MAEQSTFTVDTTPQTETMGDSLTPDEQDSLAVGEQLIEQQEQLLAGKYKDAADLEKAYIELQRKLGEDGTEEKAEVAESESEPEAEVEEEKSPYSEQTDILSAANDEYYSNEGKLSEETIEKISSMDSKALVNAYLEMQKDNPQGQAVDLSDSDVEVVKKSVGGEDNYSQLMQWAGQNLDESAKEAFDTVISSGNMTSIKFAVAGLKAQYDNANGYEGTMYSGKAPQQTKDTFRSQAELVAAMNDRRYDKDPAYRQDVIAKLERSDNLQF